MSATTTTTTTTTEQQEQQLNQELVALTSVITDNARGNGVMNWILKSLDWLKQLFEVYVVGKLKDMPVCNAHVFTVN